MTSDSEIIQKYKEILMKIESAYNYDEPEKNAYLIWYQEKKQRGEKTGVSFPDFVWQIIKSSPHLQQDQR